MTEVTQELIDFTKILVKRTNTLKPDVINQLKHKKENILNKLKSLNGDINLLDEYLKSLNKDDLLYNISVLIQLTPGFSLDNMDFILLLRNNYNNEMKILKSIQY